MTAHPGSPEHVGGTAAAAGAAIGGARAAASGERVRPEAEAVVAAAAVEASGAEPRLEEAAFRHFAPLLRAAQGYAGHSGCRFRSSSFDGLEGGVPAVVPACRARDPGPRLAAKLASADTVAEFRRRLAAGEEALCEEVDRAYRIVMAESVRNGMIGLFQTLDMFPPVPPPPDIRDDDGTYEDVSADLVVVAQRLYNDQARRLGSEVGGAGFVQRRAMTAAFLLDFAEACGHPLPPIPETQQSMLQEITARVQEELKRRGESDEVQRRARDSFLGALGVGSVAEKLRLEAHKFWQENWKTVMWTAAGFAVLGVVGAAAAVLANRSSPRNRRRGSEL